MSDVERSRLVGRWVGRGGGSYPTIDDFEYLETVTITASPKGFLVYHQATQHPQTGAPMHTETGYLRFPAPGLVEFVVAQPTGVTEAYEGSVEAPEGAVRLRLRTTSVARTGTAKEVSEVERDFVFQGDVLSYVMRMASVGQPMTHHLRGELLREP